MTLSHHDHDVDPASTTKPAETQRSHAGHTSWWVFATMAFVVAFAGGLALAAILGDSGETTSFDQEVVADYAVDTPVVLYAPPAAAGFLGADANLDPDNPTWWNPEYGTDTAAVVYTEVEPTGFIGTDANLDPDAPTWWNPEYGTDTAAVVYTEVEPTGFIGQDANLDP